MATYVLIHGASADSWYWHRVVPALRARGHEVVAPDLPVSDHAAGLVDYANVVVDAIGGRTDLIVVAHSLAGFVGPLVCARVRADLLVLLTAMVPLPGESLGQWWVTTGWERARREHEARAGRKAAPGYDHRTLLYHDVPPEVTSAALARGESAQSATPFTQPWPLAAWPEVPTVFLLCREDRFFPAPFMRRIVRERLGITPDELDSGHLPALSHPLELVERLEAYRVRYSGVAGR